MHARYRGYPYLAEAGKVAGPQHAQTNFRALERYSKQPHAQHLRRESYRNASERVNGFMENGRKEKDKQPCQSKHREQVRID